MSFELDGMSKEEFLGAVEILSPYADLQLVGDCYDYGRVAHSGQSRSSGEPYFTHAMAVALSLAEWHQDSQTIAAGLIHDVVEDTVSTVDDIGREFGPEMAALVDGVTKISTQFSFNSHAHKQAENFRKMLLSMARDIRVILVKFADRLHNMQTLDHLTEEKQERIALETREIYAPLAHRLGMAKVKWELEDLCMKYLERDAYRDIASKIVTKRDEREGLIDAVRVPLSERIEEAELQATIIGRPKHFYSIYKKMVTRSKPFDEIYDLLAIRVVTDTIEHCYHILGIVHGLWKPVHDRFKDYIATPKSNMYQSLHTTVAGPTGELVEIQIRTEDMDQTAEQGIAAHWLYKEGTKQKAEDKEFQWLRQVMEWQRELTDPHEFMEYLKIDLFQDECFVFTPRGDLLRLPAGSTPIDFAFSVHTEVGMHCAGAKVNDRFVTLTTPLANGDVVEIQTNPTQQPSRDWLDVVKTSKAKSKIRQLLRRRFREASIKLGKEIFEKEARKKRVSIRYDKKFTQHVRDQGFDEVDDMFAAVAQGEITANYILRRLSPPAEETRAPAVVSRLIDRARGVRGIRVEGMDNLMIRLAECCQPVSGDKVFGYITRGRGVTIHRVDCPNSFSLMDTERRVEVQWAVKEEESFVVAITIVASDRRDLLLDLTKEISRQGIYIQRSSIQGEDGIARGDFVIAVSNLQQLRKVMRDLQKISGVQTVSRRLALDDSAKPRDVR